MCSLSCIADPGDFGDSDDPNPTDEPAAAPINGHVGFLLLSAIFLGLYVKRKERLSGL